MKSIPSDRNLRLDATSAGAPDQWGKLLRNSGTHSFSNERPKILSDSSQLQWSREVIPNRPKVCDLVRPLRKQGCNGCGNHNFLRILRGVSRSSGILRRFNSCAKSVATVAKSAAWCDLCGSSQSLGYKVCGNRTALGVILDCFAATMLSRNPSHHS